MFLKKTHVKFDNEEEEPKKEDLKFDDDENASDDELYEELPGKAEEGEDVDETQYNIAKDDTISDLDYFKAKISSKSIKDPEADEEDDDDDEEDEDEEGNEENNEEAVADEEDEVANQDVEEMDEAEQAKGATNTASEQTEGKAKQDEKDSKDDKDDIEDSGRLFVRNLAYSVTEDDLYQLFRKYGEVSEIHLPIDKDLKRIRTIAYVLYMIPSDAFKAMKALDGAIFQGRLLHILPAKPPPAKPKVEEDGQEGSYKKKKLDQLKANSTKEVNWNTLFLRSDTVADSIAAKYNVTKGELLSPDADNLAVRMTLGEAQIISETKKFLAKQGVDLTALSAYGTKAVKRSNTTILIKNIPYQTEVEELRSLFNKFGLVAKICLPPSKAMGLIELVEPTEAKTAFRSLAYSNFKGVPLYLEWAPIGVFKKSAIAEETQDENDQETKPSTGKVEEPLNEAEINSILFIKNLNFKTTEEDLKMHIEKAAPVVRVSIAKKKDVRSGQQISMGYGFAHFLTKEHSVSVLKLLQGQVLDDHALEMKFSAKKENESEPSKKGRKTSTGVNIASSKLIVRNLAFEATKKDVSDLFRALSSVKSVRLPKKANGQHRGFAFVEFTSKEEAKKAMDLLKDSHLYGRHLVLEFALEDSTSSSSSSSMVNKQKAYLSQLAG